MHSNSYILLYIIYYSRFIIIGNALQIFFLLDVKDVVLLILAYDGVGVCLYFDFKLGSTNIDCHKN